MPIRAFRPDDADVLVTLARASARGETDFVLNPLWEHEEELFADFARHRIAPEQHLLVAESALGIEGAVGFLRQPEARTAGLVCPIVASERRGRGLGGELLRAALQDGRARLGIEILSAAIGARNRAGYSLLTALGFRATRQHFLLRLAAPPAVPRRPLAAGLQFAAARPDDADAVLALYEYSGFAFRDRTGTRAALADPRRSVAIARHGDRVVAVAELETHWPTRPWVSYVGVETGLRDRGLGSTLVAWALTQQFRHGARSALLLLSPGNRTALRAYEKVGFRRYRVLDVLERKL
jgi:ribosomal protein S18 acetylase RimI-like enzyme